MCLELGPPGQQQGESLLLTGSDSSGHPLANWPTPHTAVASGPPGAVQFLLGIATECYCRSEWPPGGNAGLAGNCDRMLLPKRMGPRGRFSSCRELRPNVTAVASGPPGAVQGLLGTTAECYCRIGVPIGTRGTWTEDG
jgi:hypothetical protein